MAAHDADEGRKSQTGPFAGLLGGEEGFEDLVDDRPRNSLAGILDSQYYKFSGLPPWIMLADISSNRIFAALNERGAAVRAWHLAR